MNFKNFLEAGALVLISLAVVGTFLALVAWLVVNYGSAELATKGFEVLTTVGVASVIAFFLTKHQNTPPSGG